MENDLTKVKLPKRLAGPASHSLPLIREEGVNERQLYSPATVPGIRVEKSRKGKR